MCKGTACGRQTHTLKWAQLIINLTTGLLLAFYKNTFYTRMFFSDSGGTEEPRGIFVYWGEQMLTVSRWGPCSSSFCFLASDSKESESVWSESVLFWFLCTNCIWPPIPFFPMGNLDGKHFQKRQDSSQETAATRCSMGIWAPIALIAAAEITPPAICRHSRHRLESFWSHRNLLLSITLLESGFWKT